MQKIAFYVALPDSFYVLLPKQTVIELHQWAVIFRCAMAYSMLDRHRHQCSPLPAWTLEMRRSCIASV
jgi:hypothetical protein